MDKSKNDCNRPFTIDMKPGRYAWCTCGATRNEPFCDGHHEETGMYPMVVEIKEAGLVNWCGCKCSENKPYCDGSHVKRA